ncbi:MAG: glycosyl hydrolase-related protein [Massiliimalia sp.]
MKNQPLQKIYYLASTHWDREWYRPFQGFRYRLVKVTKEILDTLDQMPEFETFVFDGQTVVLEDFTQIEPKRADQLKRLISSNRLKVGPWYVMPDEFLVSGESLVRNLMMGHRLAKDYGADQPMKYGYLCDVFGHVAQMPQILNQFGIQGALVGRGTNLHTTPAHFLWEAPDGSQCITFKVPEECGYGTFWFDVWYPYSQDQDDQALVQRACEYITREQARSDLPFVLLMDGMDHERIHPKAPWLAKQLEKQYGCPVVFRSPEEMAAELSQCQSEMPVKRGELNETDRRCVEHNMLITYTLSSRYDLKKENDQCQSLLEHWIEPIYAAAKLSGFPFPDGYKQQMYRYLISCHAHDSICGCSIDGVHQDMHYRFRQVKSIGQELIWDAVQQFRGGVCPDETSEEYQLRIMNPLPFERREVIQAKIDFQPGYRHTYCEQAKAEWKNAFRLLDEAGNEISYVITDLHKNQFVNVPGESYRQQRDGYTIAFSAVLPPCKTAQYRVVPCDRPVRCLRHLSQGIGQAESETMRLWIASNGSVTLTDKLTGRVYENLLTYVDDADIGDGWFYGKPIGDRAVSSQGFPSSIELLYDHQDVCCFQIVTWMRLPVSSNHCSDHWGRSQQTEELPIASKITFYREKRYVDVTVSVDNHIQDHRLKVMLPTGIPGGTYQADQAFCFVTRKTGIDDSTHDWKECEKYEKSFEHIVLKRDENQNGIAFLSSYGLHECAALDDPQGTLAVTLFRCFDTTFLTNGEPDGQLQGKLEFSYRIQLLSAEDSLADLQRSAEALRAGIVCDSMPVAPGTPFASWDSLLVHTGKDTAVSMIKLPEAEEEDALIVRVVNYSEHSAPARLEFCRPIEQAWEVTLEEQALTQIPFEGNGLITQLRPWQIKTVKVTLKERSQE